MFQNNSYLKELTTTVVSCQPSKEEGCHEVILADTIFFPEGGGQPDDHGFINAAEVKKVSRTDGKIIHLVNQAFKIDEEVNLGLDWNRRFQHMQQHSGQHLITALWESKFGFKTTSWSLGPKVCNIELDTSKVTEDQLQEIEQLANEKIRDNTKVSIHFFQPGDEELKMINTRLEIPKGEGDFIRVIEIEGIDKNTCCGTHVSSLKDLQCIKLMYAEKGKKNKTNIYFLVGQRVLDYLSNCINREKELNLALKCGAEQHVEISKKLQTNLKLANKNCLTAQRDLAVLQATNFNSSQKDKYFSLHRPDAERDYLTAFLSNAKITDQVLFLTVGQSTGHMILCGPSSIVEELGPKVAEILKGKGNFSDGKFQAKVSNLKARDKAESLIKSHLNPVNEGEH